MSKTGTNIHRDRKYKTFLLVFLSTTAMLVLDKLSGAEYVQFNIYSFGLWMAGNVGAHAATAYKEKVNAQSNPK